MGYKIKEAREKAMITQAELAKRSGVSRSTISALENGQIKTTTTKTLLRLAAALNTTVDEIFFTQSRLVD